MAEELELQFGVLGPVAATGSERPAAVCAGHQRTILAVLLASGGAIVTSERLIDALWENDPPAGARKTMQSHVSRLRRALRDADPSAVEPLTTTSDGYQVDVDAHELDAARFEALHRRARDLVDDDPERAVEILDDALRLWRGPAFGDLDSHPHVRPEAVRLDALRARAERERVDARLALGDHEEVVGELEAAAAADPIDERVHAQLMLALYRSSRQIDALDVFHRLRERLRDEVGVDPSPAVQQLHERILHQDHALKPSDLVAPGHTDASTSGHRFEPPPAPATELIGREGVVSEVGSLVLRSPLVTLTGPGGVGKTRVAEQVAVDLADQFDGGVAGCALAPVQNPDRVGDALVTMLGIQASGDQPPVETLVGAIAERRLLLLLDNCEHVLEAVTPVIETILGRCPRVAILATSRERLQLSAEQVRQVSPLDVPSVSANAEALAGTPSGALFAARAAAAEPTFSLTDDNAPAVAQLCRRLDGMPLAIELAAARVRALSPEDLLARLEERFSVLVGGPRSSTDRHRTLQSVVAWSHDLLPDAEAALFDRLSVFAGSFTLVAAERICADGRTIRASDVAGLLSELVEKSMVVVTHEDGAVRYRLLDTLRAFGAERLDESGDTENHRRAHAAYHVEFAEEIGPRVRTPDERDAVVAINNAVNDLRTAHAWLVDVGDVDGALRLPTALCDDVFFRMRDEVTTWVRRALALPGASTHPAYPAALASAAVGASQQGEYTRAVREANEALEEAQPVSLARVWAHLAVGIAALFEGRFEDMEVQFIQMEETAQRLGERHHVAHARFGRVLAALYGGDRNAALEHLADFEQAAAAAGVPTMLAWSHYCRGEIHLETHPAEAAAWLQQAVDLAREVNNVLLEGVSLVSLASLEGRRGNTGHALRLYRTVIDHWRARGFVSYQLTTIRNLVVLLTQVGADGPAAVLHGAVSEGLKPSFGAEAERFAAAWQRTRDRLGPEAAAVAAARGRDLTMPQVVEQALSDLDALLDR